MLNMCIRYYKQVAYEDTVEPTRVDFLPAVAAAAVSVCLSVAAGWLAGWVHRCRLLKM